MRECRVALAWLGWAAGLAVAAVVLGAATPALLRAVDTAAAGPDDAVAAVAALTGWVILGWLTAGTALTLLAVLARAAGGVLTGVGRRLDRLAAIVTPTGWGDAVRTSVRIGVIAGATGGSLLGLPAQAAPALDPRVGHVRLVDQPAPVYPDLDRPAARPTYRVRSGDCLWSIAERALGPGATDAQVARAWPLWWRANRRVIGPDPGMLHPGQRLVVPDGVLTS